MGTGHDFSSDTGGPLPNRPLPRQSMFSNLDLFIAKMGWDLTAILLRPLRTKLDPLL